jgi:hypothetical protein
VDNPAKADSPVDSKEDSPDDPDREVSQDKVVIPDREVSQVDSPDKEDSQVVSPDREVSLDRVVNQKVSISQGFLCITTLLQIKCINYLNVLAVMPESCIGFQVAQEKASNRTQETAPSFCAVWITEQEGSRSTSSRADQALCGTSSCSPVTTLGLFKVNALMLSPPREEGKVVTAEKEKTVIMDSTPGRKDSLDPIHHQDILTEGITWFTQTSKETTMQANLALAVITLVTLHNQRLAMGRVALRASSLILVTARSLSDALTMVPV